MDRNRNVSELAHHGIKGQRWGRRRFQNTDGSLTPAGRKRYSNYNPYADANYDPYASPNKNPRDVNYADPNYNPYYDIRYENASPRIKSAKVRRSGGNEGSGGTETQVNARYESLSNADKLRYLRRQGYDLPRSSPKLKSDTTDASIDNNDGGRHNVTDNSPKIKSATFNRPNTSNSNKPDTNNSNQTNTSNSNSNKPNTNNSNQTNTNNGKKRPQDMTTEELRADNMHYAALNQYKKNHGIKSQGEIRKDITDQAGKAISSAKDIGNSISKIRSLDKPGPDYSHLSNAELQERINRINLEQRYADLTRPRESSKAVKFKEAMNIVGGAVAFTGSVLGIANAIKDLRSSS